MKLNLSKLNKQLKESLLECLQDIDFTECDSGVNLIANKSDEFSVNVTDGQIVINYNKLCEFFAGVTIALSGKQGQFTANKNACNLSLMTDCSRNGVLKPQKVKDLIRTLALSGYAGLSLYTEDTYEVDGEPYFGYLRGRYTKEELKQLDAYANKFGIELIPCIQTLAHLNGITSWWNEYTNVTMDLNDILLVGSERVYTLIENMFKTVSECFTTKRVNIGMDEAWLLGAGKYKFLNGNQTHFEIMKKHLARISVLAEKYNLRPMMWSDMFFRALVINSDYYNNEPIPQETYTAVPENIGLIYWDYDKVKQSDYERMIKRHLGFNREIWFAGSCSTAYRFASNCNGAIEHMIPAIKACKKFGIKDFMNTQWGDDGADASVFSALPTFVATFSENVGLNKADMKKIFKVLSGGVTYEDFTAISTRFDRYFLYNDCIVGALDTTTEEGYEENYKKAIKRLNRAINKNGKYSYMLNYVRQYFKVMTIKYNLGNVTREIYQSGDKQGLKNLVKTSYKPLIREIKKLYTLSKERWDYEYKPYGFEVQDIRYGGLLLRLEHVVEKLNDYINGKVENIEELDQVLLDWNCHFDKHEHKMIGDILTYAQAVTVNVLNK